MADEETPAAPTEETPLQPSSSARRLWSKVGITNVAASRLSSGRRTSVSNDPSLQHVLAETPLRGSTLILATYLQKHQQQQLQDRRRSSRWTPPNWWTRHVSSQLPAGSLPQSLVIAAAIAVVNGVGCFFYYEALEVGLELVWKTLPVHVLQLSDSAWWWIPAAGGSLCLLLGLTVVLLGEPGDMPFTVACVHHKGYIPIDHVMPMVLASFFSIVAGASLGPEAPLLAICGACAGWISRNLFGTTSRHVLRKHTLMGMAGALAAFFGAPLGGSFFALEINSRFGVEYYEDLMESILCGELTLLVFRTLTTVPIGPLWDFGSDTLQQATANVNLLVTIGMGFLLGLVGAGLAYVFAVFHAHWLQLFSVLGLLDNSRAVYRALLGGVFFYALGLAIPHVLFWAEEEIQVVVARSPASELPHVWPTSGWFGFEIDQGAPTYHTLLLGLAKLVAISCSLAQGSRGGFIFPFFLAGGAVGRAIADWVDIDQLLPVPVALLCVAAATNVAITRTALATTLILVFLSGEVLAGPAILMASLTSLFSTGTIQFIKTQMARSDIDHSLFYQQEKTVRPENEHDNDLDQDE